MDSYVLAAFIFLTSVAVENAVVGRFDASRDVDNYIFAAIAGINSELWITSV